MADKDWKLDQRIKQELSKQSSSPDTPRVIVGAENK
jgi:hypothetical protein